MMGTKPMPGTTVRERDRNSAPETTPLGVWSPPIYLKMMHQLPGLDFDDNVVLLKSSLQHLLVGQLEHDLCSGTNGDVDGELLHCSS